jgi:hypothetical protein
MLKPLALGATLAATLAAAQEQDAQAQANNPLAAMTAFNLQNYYIGDLTDTDTDGNTFLLRYARPFSLGGGDWLMRATLPVNTLPNLDSGHDTGLGDFNAFATYILDTGRSGMTLGIGPLIVAPTASEDTLGAGKWQLGLANILFDASSKRVQWGYLLTYQVSVAGESDREDVSLAALQPFGFLQLGQGWYARSTGVWTYDFEHDYYALPVGMGLGKVIPTEKVVYNAFVEPQYSLDTKGPGQAKWQIFAGLNLQFR